MTTSSVPDLNFSGKLIRRDGDFWCLTDMWKAAGEVAHNKPAKWFPISGVSAFVVEVEKRYHSDLAARAEKVPNKDLFPSAVRRTKGRHGETWAHWQVALAYAKYLSPEFHLWANDTVRRVLDADPALVEEMFDRMSVPDQQHTAERLEGKVARRAFTDTLKQHGVVKNGYALCTEAIQAPILGMSTKDAKAARGLTKGSVREVMDTSELAQTRMAEVAAARRIEIRDVRGNYPCARESARSAQIVKAAFDQIVNGE